MTVVSMCHLSSARVVRRPTFGFAGCTRSRGDASRTFARGGTRSTGRPRPSRAVARGRRACRSGQAGTAARAVRRRETVRQRDDNSRAKVQNVLCQEERASFGAPDSVVDAIGDGWRGRSVPSSADPVQRIDAVYQQPFLAHAAIVNFLLPLALAQTATRVPLPALCWAGKTDPSERDQRRRHGVTIFWQAEPQLRTPSSVRIARLMGMRSE
jgi:hypothetical protein